MFTWYWCIYISIASLQCRAGTYAIIIKKAVPYWISYFKMDALYTSFSNTTPEFIIFL